MQSTLVSFTPRSHVVLQMLQQATAADRKKIGQLHFEWEHTFRAAPPDAQREGLAAGIHRVIDEAMTRRQAMPGEPPISCRKGCAACCRQLVSVTPDEAKLLAFAAHEAGHVIDRARLARQAAAVGLQGWRELDSADKRCVMLKDDATCAVYEHRPTACRKYQVVSPPSRCDIERHPGAQVVVAIGPEAEVIASAALGVFGSGPFAVQLRAALEDWDRAEPAPEDEAS